MTRVDLHPEELFDQLRAGTLSTLDAARLDAHCRSCAACRLELQLAGTQPFGQPSAADRALADAVASRMLAPLPDPRRRVLRPSVAALGTASRRRTGMLVLGAALGCMSAAAFWTGAPAALMRAVGRQAEHARPAPAAEQQPRVRVAPPPSQEPASSVRNVTPEVPAPEVVEPSRPTKRPPRRSEPVSAPIPQPTAAAEAAPPLPPPAPAQGDALVPAPAAPVSVATRARPAPALQVSPRTATPTSSSDVPSTRADAARPNAQSLLRAASSARSAADYERAAEHYRQLLDQFPRSAESSIARVPYARLLCQRLDEAEDAVALFESYLRDEPRGNLRQEAQSGLAQCLDSDGRSAEARSVWQQLLREHPDSIYAKRARARLGGP